MATKDFSSNRFMRSLQQRTARRRGAGRKRTRTVGLVVLALILLMGLALPSLICNTTLGRTVVLQWAERYQWQATAEEMQFGWITPLKLKGVRFEGPSGQTHAEIASLETERTLLQFLRGFDDMGRVTLDGPSLQFVIAEGRTSLERDLDSFLQSSSDSNFARGTIELFDATIRVGDAQSERVWQANQLQAKVVLSGKDVQWESTAVVTDPNGASGALQMACKVPTTASEAASGWETGGWDAELQLNSMPLYVADLLKRRFTDSMHGLPDSLQGDASGAVRLSARSDGGIDATFRQLELRRLAASDRRLGDRIWANQLATLSGQLQYTGEALIGQNLKATTDFGGATVSGSLATSDFGATPLAWLEAIDGNAVLEIDLPALNRSAPGLIPMRPGAELVSGKVHAEIASGWGQDQVYRSNWNVASDPLRATAAGRSVVVEPVEARATWRLEDGRLTAEEIRLRSEFGNVSGSGDLRSGRGQFRVDFGRLAAILRPVVELPEASFDGLASGDVEWTTAPDGQWRLQGDVEATEVAIALPGGRTLRPGALVSSVEASGRWGGETLTQLTSAQATLRQQQRQQWQASLTRAVDRPTSHSLYPVTVTGSGEVAALSQWAGAWLPGDLHSLDGRFQLTGQGRISADVVQLTQTQLELQQPRVGWKQYVFRQPFLNLDFAGQWSWATADLDAQKLTVAGEAVSLAVEGSSSAEVADLFVSWRADLQRLQRSLETLPATPPPAGSQNRPSNRQGWMWQGACEGRAKLNGRDGIWEIDTDASAQNLALLQPPRTSTASDFVGPSRPGRQQASLPQVVWSEPQATVRGMIRYDARSGGAIADAVRVSSNWLSTDLTGEVVWNDSVGTAKLSGPAKIAMDVVAQRLSGLIGQRIEATGTQSTPLEIAVDRREDGSLAMDVQTTLGWESGKVSGVAFGKSSIPVRLTETTVHVEPAVLPIGNGRLNVAGEVHYRPGPLWFEQRPGTFAEDLRLEPEMTRTWLKYLAPLASEATEISGSFSVDLDEAVVVVDDMARSRVSGRLQVQGAQLNAGPLAQQVIGTVEAVKSLARGLQGPPRPSTTRRLITLQPQTIDFSVQNGIVRHQRLFMTIDNAQLVTSGAVSTGGQLELLAQVPLQENWLGSELKSLAGQNVSLPIRGTLSSPRVDSSGLTQMASQLGSQAIRQTAENVLQEQLNRGMQKIFGR